MVRGPKRDRIRSSVSLDGRWEMGSVYYVATRCAEIGLAIWSLRRPKEMGNLRRSGSLGGIGMAGSRGAWSFNNGAWSSILSNNQRIRFCYHVTINFFVTDALAIAWLLRQKQLNS